MYTIRAALTLLSFLSLGAAEHSFMLELCNRTTRPITIVRISPPAAWIQDGQILEPRSVSRALIVPHTSITITCNNYAYTIHIRSKEKHPAQLVFQNSHRPSHWIEPINIKAAISQLRPEQSS